MIVVPPPQSVMLYRRPAFVAGLSFPTRGAYARGHAAGERCHTRPCAEARGIAAGLRRWFLVAPPRQRRGLPKVRYLG